MTPWTERVGVVHVNGADVSSSAAAAALIDRYGELLARAVRPAVQLLDPECVMVGGPLADALGERLRRGLERGLQGCDGHPPAVVDRAPCGPEGSAAAAVVILHDVFMPV
jgi:predicted NBD/HSP70 family sugar kinase